MSQADVQFNNLAADIIYNGYTDVGQEVRGRYADGTPAHTKFLLNKRFEFDNSEFPILTTKQVGFKTPIKESPIWMWQNKSNNVQELRDMGVHIWDEWERPDNTIGKAYGFQLGKKVRKIHYKDFDESLVDPTKPIEFDGEYVLLDQVDYLLHQLKHNPFSRRHLVQLWNIDDLDDMALPPCVYESRWTVTPDYKLHLKARARSTDVGLGLSFNIGQYNILQRKIAQVVGLSLGDFIFDMDMPHIYDRHEEVVLKHMRNENKPAPELWINPDVKNFYEFTPNDFKLINYKHGGKYPMEVAI